MGRNLKSQLISASRKAGGSHLTQEARESALSRFADFLKKSNIQITKIEQIKERHIAAYFAQRDVSERTKQNELSALRVALREAGRESFADKLDTRKMGIKEASREGTHRAITEPEYQKAVEAARALDPGVAAALTLCREFGLRSKEAVMARQEVLARWERELASKGRISVLEGTKGGRYRETHPVDRSRALEAVRAAREVAERNGGYLVVGRGGNLRSALDRFHYVAREAGLRGEISPHSLRYAYAQERIAQRVSEGFSLREARIATSLDLGHGDGRGRWIEHVYGKN